MVAGSWWLAAGGAAIVDLDFSVLFLTLASPGSFNCSDIMFYASF